MARPFQGTSNQTKKGLIDSGAMVKEDFEPDEPPGPPLSASSGSIKRDKTRMIPLSEYNSRIAKNKKKKEADYAAELAKRHKK